jgi:uroporphyrinogen-III decarboxylase
MLSAKENFLRVLRGEDPEFIPVYTMGMIRGGEATASDTIISPDFLMQFITNPDHIDIWGVKYIPVEEANGAVIPDNTQFILNDIRNWRDVIKAPDISQIDWEKMYREELKSKNIDRSQTAVLMNVMGSYFQNLMAFMGFMNGLCAYYEEPDEVHALYEYLSDFYYEVAVNYMDVSKPDVVSLFDDSAAWGNPFISRDMFREFLLPHYARLTKLAVDRGIPVSFHNCGLCEIFIDDYVDIGVTMWDPAQTCNDLAGIKKKYGKKLVIAGGWDARNNLLADAVTYDEIFAYTKGQFDMLAPNGGYVFMGGFLGAVGDKNIAKKNDMLQKAVKELQYKYY